MPWPGTVASLGDNWNSSSPFTTFSIPFTSGKMYLVACAVHDNDGNATTPSISNAGGQSWFETGGNTVDNDPEWELNVFFCFGNGTASTIQLSSSGADGISYAVIEFSTFNVVSAVPQTKAEWNRAGETTSLTITLDGAFQNADSGLLGVFLTNSAGNITPGSGFTQLEERDEGGFCLHVNWDASPASTSVSASAGSADWAGWALEIATPGSGNVTELMAKPTATGAGLSATVKINAAIPKAMASSLSLPLTAGVAATGAVLQVMSLASASAIHRPLVVFIQEFEIVFNTEMAKQYFHKIYNQAGEFVGLFPATVLPSFSWDINGGHSTLTQPVPRRYGAAGEHGEPNSTNDLDLGHILETWVVDREAPLGVLIHSGLIEEYEIQEPPQESIPVAIFPLITRTVDNFIYGPFIGVSPGDPSDIMQALIVGGYLPGITWDATNPLVGPAFEVSYDKMRAVEIMENLRRLSGSNWYWRLNADNSLTFNKFNLKNPATHQLSGNNVSIIRYVRSRVERKKRVYVFGAESHDEFGLLVERIEGFAMAPGYDPEVEPRDLFHTDSRITDNVSAARVAAALLEFYNQDLIETEIEILDSNQDPDKGYDIESLKPGDTVEIFNPHQAYARTRWGLFEWAGDEWNNNFAGLVQGPLVIANIQYSGSHARVKLTNKPAAVIEELVNVNDRLLLEGST